LLAIAIFLAAGQWKLRRLVKDLPGRLGVDIQQQADGVNYTQTRKGKTLFKIHAARAVQMKKDGKTLLHDVHIDLYGEDGKRADTISGSEFEYDPNAGVAQAPGLSRLP
jgi:lipopolysaccharide export system protein LptA